jgi:hypothetical protein
MAKAPAGLAAATSAAEGTFSGTASMADACAGLLLSRGADGECILFPPTAATAVMSSVLSFSSSTADFGRAIDAGCSASASLPWASSFDRFLFFVGVDLRAVALQDMHGGASRR